MKTFEAALTSLSDLIRSIGVHASSLEESTAQWESTLRSLQESLVRTKALSDKRGLTRISTELESLEKLLWQETSWKRIFQLQKFFKLFANRLQALTARTILAPTSAQKKVLVIEDSQVTQLLLKKFLTTDQLEVVGTAAKEEEVFKLLETTCPDVITLDIFLGGTNGFALVEKILNQYPIPIVLISSIQGSAGIQVFHALYRGCLDFISKVSLTQSLDREAFCQRITKAAQANMTSLAKYYGDPAPAILKGALDRDKLLAIGVAPGGMRSLIDLMTSLPKEVPPILIDQRVAPEFTTQLVQLLQEVCSFTVKAASQGDEVRPNTALLAPAGKVLSLSPDLPMRVELLDDLEARGESPLNLFFQSIGQSIGQSIEQSHGLAVLLGGYGHDGAAGLAAVRREGCITLVEDESSSYDPTLARETLLIQGAVIGVKSESIPEVVVKALTAPPTRKELPALELLARTQTNPPHSIAPAIPQVTSQPGALTKNTPPMEPTRFQGKVLIVDDSPTIRAILKHGLQSLGITDCYEAESGAEAWQLIQSLSTKNINLDLIISDQNMPGMTGKDLLDRVRDDARFKIIPFILATAETDQNQVLDALKKGVTDYITKPVSIALLRKKLQTVLERAKAA